MRSSHGEQINTLIHGLADSQQRRHMGLFHFSISSDVPAMTDNRSIRFEVKFVFGCVWFVTVRTV